MERAKGEKKERKEKWKKAEKERNMKKIKERGGENEVRTIIREEN